MENIKTLANCTPEEFMVQGWKIAESVQNWLTITKIMEIRRRLPEFEKIPPSASKEERKEINRHNDELREEQAKKNLFEILKSCMKEHPKETAEILKLLCFEEPGDEGHPMFYYIGAFNQIISNEEVINFFLSLVHLGQIAGVTA